MNIDRFIKRIWYKCKALHKVPNCHSLVKIVRVHGYGGSMCPDDIMTAYMGTSRITDPLWSESTGRRWILLTGTRNAELWCFLCCQPEVVEETVELVGDSRRPDANGMWVRYMEYFGLGAVSIRKTVLPGMAIPMLKIRRPNGRLIFNMEITIRR